MKVTSFDLRRFLALALVILTSGVLTVRAEVLLTALEGTKGVKDTENYQMMFDGKLDTKWCVTNFTEAYVIVRASEKIAPRMYSMVTGGDIELHPYRNWKRWRIYGANFDAPEQAVRNAEEWTLIDQKQDIGPDMLPPINTFTVSFTLSEPNDTPYEYFRIEVDGVLNVPVAQNVMMMTEFSFDEIRKVGYTALDGVAGFGAAEGYASLVDGLSSTKWCSNVGDWWIIFRSDEPIAPAYYCLVTGNDTYTNQGRNWTAWEIYGGNFTADDQATRDAKGWTVLDERKEVGQDRLPVTNLTEAYFGISGSGTKYQYFMVHVSGIVGGNIQQMSELTFGEAATLPRVIAQYTDELKQYSLDFTADAALKQAYEQKMGELQTCKDLEVALSLYADIKALQVELNLSRNAYETYIKTVEYLLTYVDEHPQMSAQGKQLIQQYTQERVEPNANFPRGSYPYIMELMNLSVTDLNEEVDYLYQLLEQYGSSTSGYIETTLETFDGTVGVK
ncbi:MAG: hypothetical protein IJR87_03500, partial [Bacteroidaceae bacterium]|nr:hypothetical protein [Bacteroidaceae bacterium]